MMTGRRQSFEGPEILRRIHTPTLVIHGEEDNIIDFKSSYHFEENINDVKVRIYPEIGHLPMYEDPENTANDIKKFIQEIK